MPARSETFITPELVLDDEYNMPWLIREDGTRQCNYKSERALRAWARRAKERLEELEILHSELERRLRGE